MIEWSRTSVPELLAAAVMLGVVAWFAYGRSGRALPRPSRGLLRRPWVVPAVLLVVGLVAAFVARTEHVRSSDEWSYLFQADLFASGRLSVPRNDVSHALQIGWVNVDDEKLYSMYPPVWPALLAPFRLVGLDRFANLLLGVGTVALTMHATRVRTSRSAGLLAGLFAAACPFTVLMLNSWFSHVSCGLLLLGALHTLLPTRAGPPGTRSLLLSGVLWGAAFGVRPFTVVLAILATTLCLLLTVRDRAAWMRRLVLVTPGGLLVGALLCLYNIRTTGHPLQFGYAVSSTWGGVPLFSLAGDNWRHTAIYLVQLVIWGVAVVPFAALFVLGRARRLQGVQRTFAVTCLGVAAAVMGGYAFLRIWQGNSYGPRYYFEVYPALCAVAAMAFRARAVRPQAPAARRRAAFACAYALALAALVFLPYRVWDTRGEMTRLMELSRTEATLTRPTLMFVQRPFYDWVRNPPDLDGKVVRVALGMAPADDVVAVFPDRALYLRTRDGNVRPATLAELRTMK